MHEIGWIKSLQYSMASQKECLKYGEVDFIVDSKRSRKGQISTSLFDFWRSYSVAKNPSDPTTSVTMYSRISVIQLAIILLE